MDLSNALIHQNYSIYIFLFLVKFFSKQLTDTISYIAETEFPTSWDWIFKNIWERLKYPSDNANFFGSLLALKSLVKNYEYLQKVDREPLEFMVEDTFPILAICSKNVLTNYNNDQVENVLRIIMKIFYKAIYVSIL